MTLFEINPLTDVRWQEFVQSHPDRSVVHGAGWLRALVETYGYRPCVFTTTPPDSALTNGIVFCEVRSWITGCRFVSLPFTDICPSLANDKQELRKLVTAIQADPRFAKSKYVEIRDPRLATGMCSDLCDVSSRFMQHTLSLDQPIEKIYSRFHDSCVRRKIRRAEKDGLRIESGRADAIVRNFYHLMVLTRRRHGLPPQPLSWFRNLTSSTGDQMDIKIAFHGNVPVSGIVTLKDSKTMTYKYGASDPSMFKFGGAPLLMWSAISEAKALNLSVFDFGRSDLEDEGLIQFKDRFGAASTLLTYCRVSGYVKHHDPISQSRHGKFTPKLLRRLPESVLVVLGKLLYRHMG